jgi:hypothetical protein
MFDGFTKNFDDSIIHADVAVKKYVNWQSNAIVSSY